MLGESCTRVEFPVPVAARTRQVLVFVPEEQVLVEAVLVAPDASSRFVVRSISRARREFLRRPARSVRGGLRVDLEEPCLAGPGQPVRIVVENVTDEHAPFAAELVLARQNDADHGRFRDESDDQDVVG